jgi:hypothetical protein
VSIFQKYCSNVECSIIIKVWKADWKYLESKSTKVLPITGSDLQFIFSCGEELASLKTVGTHGI